MHVRWNGPDNWATRTSTKAWSNISPRIGREQCGRKHDEEARGRDQLRRGAEGVQGCDDQGSRELVQIRRVPGHQEARGSEEADNIIDLSWVLTRKVSAAAKAHLVIRGYQDRDLEVLATASPTASRRSRNMFLSLAARRRLSLKEGNMTAAFLQRHDRVEQRQALRRPTPELKHHLMLRDGDTRCCRGLWYGSCSLSMVGFR